MTLYLAPFFKILSQNLTNWKNFTDNVHFLDGIKAASESQEIFSKLVTKISILTTTMSSEESKKTTWNYEIMNEEDFFNSLPVSNLFPLSRTTDKSVIFYSAFYSLLFLIGVCGNVSVITLIRLLHSSLLYDNTMIYILFLCCVDLLSIVPLPMAIIDQLLGFWMFGSILCKTYRFLEHIGRALSPFLLTTIAFDRYSRVCYPLRNSSRKVVSIQLILFSLFSFLLFLPLIIKSSSEEIIINEVLLENPYRLARVRIFKCIDQMNGTPFSIFIIYTFFIGFFLPFLLNIIFYSLMFKHLCTQSRKNIFKLEISAIECYTIIITIFYGICWTPYWIVLIYSNVYLSYNEIDDDNSLQDTKLYLSSQFLYIIYFFHALPYINSSFNWLLYGLLNGHMIRKNPLKNDFSSFDGENRRDLILPTTFFSLKNKSSLNNNSGICA